MSIPTYTIFYHPFTHTPQLHCLVPIPNSSGYPLLKRRPHHSEEQVGKLRQRKTPTLLNARIPDSSLPSCVPSPLSWCPPQTRFPISSPLLITVSQPPTQAEMPYTTQGYISHPKSLYAACLWTSSTFLVHQIPHSPSLPLCLVESFLDQRLCGLPELQVDCPLMNLLHSFSDPPPCILYPISFPSFPLCPSLKTQVVTSCSTRGQVDCQKSSPQLWWRTPPQSQASQIKRP